MCLEQHLRQQMVTWSMQPRRDGIAKLGIHSAGYAAKTASYTGPVWFIFLDWFSKSDSPVIKEIQHRFCI